MPLKLKLFLSLALIKLNMLDRELPIMLALCLMLSLAYYANNYAGIIDAGLTDTIVICLVELILE